MFARMHTLGTTPEGQERGLELLREILPWVRESTGFRGVLRLASQDRSKTITITLWANEEAMLESAEAARGLGALAAEASGSERLGLDNRIERWVAARIGVVAIAIGRIGIADRHDGTP